MQSIIENRREEQDLFDSVIMPYLRLNWDAIDSLGIINGSRDNRLTLNELELAYSTAMEDGSAVDAWILLQIIRRYKNLCLSHEDGYYREEEELLGISEFDVSAYRSMLNENSGGSATFWL